MSETAFNVRLPSSVQKQLANADAIRANMSNTAPAAAPDSAPAPAPTVPAAPPAPVAAAPPGPVATVAPQPPAPPAQQPGEVEQLRTALQQAEQRFAVLQGKYNSEVQPLHDKIRDLNDQVRTAQAEVSQLRDQAKQAQVQSGAALDFFKNEISPEYADNLLALVRGQVAPIEQQFEGVQKSAAQQTEAAFWAAINTAHPDWQQINAVWLPWLAQPMPPLFEETYDQALQRAMGSRNAKAVNLLLQTYKSTEAAGATKPNSPGPTILPGSSGGGGNPAPEKRQYRQSEVQAFYQEKRKLVTGQGCIYTHEQAQALEADIFAAQRDGRITPG